MAMFDTSLRHKIEETSPVVFDVKSAINNAHIDTSYAVHTVHMICHNISV